MKPEKFESFCRQSEEAAEMWKYCDAILKDISAVKTEITENVILKSMFEGQVFSHGDVHANNIMLEHDRLWLIDFEYAGITFRSWDLSLLMTETTIAYDEGGPFVYHPESNWDLDSGVGENATLFAYLGEEAT